MNLKVILPWLLATACFGAAGFFHHTSRNQAARLTTLETQAQELEQVRAELDELKAKTAEAQQKEFARFRKDAEELLKLRGEVTQLRNEKKQLGEQVTALQSHQLSSADVQQLQAENQQLRSVYQEQTAISQRNTCINNLRQLDGAKQQWALENRKTDTAIPTEADVAVYLRNSTMVVCPVGGHYSLGPVNADPVCNIPGHALPTP